MKTQAVRYEDHSMVELYEGTLQGHAFPWHYHDCYTIVIIEDGAMNYFFRDNKILLHPGQVFVVNPFEPHYNKPHGGHCSYKVFFLAVDQLNTENTHNDLLYFERPAAFNNTLFEELRALFEKIKQASRSSLQDTVKKVSTLLLDHLPHHRQSVRYDARILPAINHIEANLGDKITIAGLARLCNLSTFHFQRIFKRSTGLTVNAWVQLHRMERSKKLIRSGGRIVSTALATGYFDQSHFHKQFIKMYATTPARFK